MTACRRFWGGLWGTCGTWAGPETCRWRRPGTWRAPRRGRRRWRGFKERERFAFFLFFCPSLELFSSFGAKGETKNSLLVILNVLPFFYHFSEPLVNHVCKKRERKKDGGPKRRGLRHVFIFSFWPPRLSKFSQSPPSESKNGQSLPRFARRRRRREPHDEGRPLSQLPKRQGAERGERERGRENVFLHITGSLISTSTLNLTPTLSLSLGKK